MPGYRLMKYIIEYHEISSVCYLSAIVAKKIVFYVICAYVYYVYTEQCKRYSVLLNRHHTMPYLL